MQWNEQSIILSVKSFSESYRIVTIFNRSLGKTCGLIKNSKVVIQSGDISEVLWKGRNSEHLGIFKIENVFSPFPFVFKNHLEILAIDSACTLCRNGLPDKAPHEKLYDSLKSLMLNVTQENWLSSYVFFEKNFLSEVGIGLNLSKCAVTGQKDGLFYVSPRTGRAVIKEVGERYKDRLFILPQFLIDNSIFPSKKDILMALDITGYFLKMYFYGISNKDLPLSREYLIQRLLVGEKNDNQYNN